MRARQTVIAGDERQMPPTSLFKASGDEQEPEERDEAREMFDAESLLVLARHRTRQMALSWHYRCQHEELIAFSNHAIYGGSLRTIPSIVSRLGPAAVRWIDVPDGRYEDGANVPEARQVVDLVERLLRQDPTPSVGVVTFNLTQRRATLDEIDRRLGADPAFAELWNRANGVPRVDHRGGERRLNVAVSRARRETWIVASFDPHQLSVARSKHDGSRLFKGFLQFARQLSAGQRNQADQTLAMMRAGGAAPVRDEVAVLPESWMPLNAQIALALEAEGLSCELDVGTSGFRVPLAVVDKANPERYLLGLLLDETVDPGTVFERHIHVPDVLATRGWKLLRLSSREWDKQRDEVLGAIRAALK